MKFSCQGAFAVLMVPAYIRSHRVPIAPLVSPASICGGTAKQVRYVCLCGAEYLRRGFSLVIRFYYVLSYVYLDVLSLSRSITVI